MPLLGMLAFLLAYVIRFDSGLIPVTRGLPAARAVPQRPAVHRGLVPLGLPPAGPLPPAPRTLAHRRLLQRARRQHLRRRARRGRHALLPGLLRPDELKDRGVYEVSQLVWGLFLVCNIALGYLSRKFIREALERRWIAGIGLRRVLIAGTGDLGRMVADKILEHRELGYQIVGFVDDRAGGDHLGYRGLPLLGTLDRGRRHRASENGRPPLRGAAARGAPEAARPASRSTSRECVDVKVVPDLLQFIALRARLEDLDGVPVINLNDVPLQGINAFVKRAIDIAVSSLALVVMLRARPDHRLADQARRRRAPSSIARNAWGSTASRSRSTSSAPCRSTPRSDTGPVWARRGRPAGHAGRPWLRRPTSTSCRSSGTSCKGDMSIVGPRPERPFFVEQFKHRIPQYMLRHKVKAGITGWAQVNGWRGNTSLEKRIEYDLYYIENWSVSLDLKIMWMTLVRALIPHRHLAT